MLRLGTGDLLIADTSAEPHGNTPIPGPGVREGRPAFDRVGVVAYAHAGNLPLEQPEADSFRGRNGGHPIRCPRASHSSNSRRA